MLGIYLPETEYFFTGDTLTFTHGVKEKLTTIIVKTVPKRIENLRRTVNID